MGWDGDGDGVMSDLLYILILLGVAIAVSLFSI